MKFYITDESNISKDEKFDFFVYGGLIFDDSQVRPMSQSLISIKQKYGVLKSRPIKWNNENIKGQGTIDKETHQKIKEEILDLIANSDTRILLYLVPQDFYHKTSLFGLKRVSIDHEKQIRTQEYAINVSCLKFDKYLKNVGDTGIVLADKFAQSFGEKMTIHCHTLYPHGSQGSLGNITFPIIQVCNEESYLHQINDVVLGAITYSMKELAYNFLPKFRDNFLKADQDDYNSIINSGINIYPKHARSNEIQSQVTKIQDKLKRLLINEIIEQV